jgi:hypothetical protein
MSTDRPSFSVHALSGPYFFVAYFAPLLEAYSVSTFPSVLFNGLCKAPVLSQN